MEYALALGGGGARGAFEAGVWDALCEMDKKVKAVCGTSIGAINGAAFAAGIRTDILWKIIRADNIIPGINCDNILSCTSLIEKIKDILNGGCDMQPLKNILKAFISEKDIRNSDIDYGLCVYSLTDKRIKQFFIEMIPDGKLIDHIIASACFPVFKNVVIDGEEFIDGGIFNNLPADMLIRRGYKNIISVSAGGPGIERDFYGRGVNIIKINYHDPEQGVMEFDAAAAELSMKTGRFECKKAFGKYMGDIFYIRSDSYIRALSHYGENVISGIEEAGRIIGINRYMEYSFSELVKAVLTHYKSNEKLKETVRKIERCPDQLLDRAYGKMFFAANTILFMQNG